MKLFRHISKVVAADNQSGNEAASSDNDVEPIPPIRFVASPPKSEQADDNVNDVNECNDEKECIFQITMSINKHANGRKALTSKCIAQILGRICLRPCRNGSEGLSEREC